MIKMQAGHPHRNTGSVLETAGAALPQAKGGRGQPSEPDHIPSSTLDNDGLDYDQSEPGNQLEGSDGRIIYHDKERKTTYYVYPAYEKVLVVFKDGTRRWLGPLEDQPAA